ncbi:hypothetical protein OAD49_02340 [Flavobacteriaceae bacterium]|nr:hypothetical protein [Flavobacteriaceae bacterium]
MNKLLIPKELQTVIGDENTDFLVYAKRRRPKSFSYGIIGFALLWLTIPSIIAYAFFKPFFKGEDVNFKVNDVPTTANWDNFEPMIIPSLFLILFLAIGVGLLIWGLITLFKKGGYYVGTENRIINYNNGTIKYFDWEQFTGNIEVNFNKKNISLEMRRGKIRERDNGPDEFIPEILHLSGIENLIKVEKICRVRIKENDPTPAIVK